MGKSGNRKWKNFGCIPRWLDGKPYDSASTYKCPGVSSSTPKGRVSLDGDYKNMSCDCNAGICWGLTFKIRGDCTKKDQCYFSYPDNRGPACYGWLIKRKHPVCRGSTCYYYFDE